VYSIGIGKAKFISINLIKDLGEFQDPFLIQKTVKEVRKMPKKERKKELRTM